LYGEGVERVFDGKQKGAVRGFFRQTNEMIASQRPSIVGHFDKVAMHNKERYFGTDEDWYLALVRETLELIKECGCVCEINTRGLYKGRYSDFYPATRIIRIMNTMEIPAVVSTDAHQPDDLDKFEGVYTLLREVGYKRLVYFDGTWREMKVL
jgi:histidinol-phosphatase (PHP family)